MEIALYILIAFAFPVAFVFTTIGALIGIDWFLRRGRTRFSLRSVLIIVTLLAFLFGGLGEYYRRVRRDEIRARAGWEAAARLFVTDPRDK